MEAELSLRIRHLRLRVETTKGRFGADLALSDGLVVLRADNSRGKSTAVKSILFALGLERMVTAKPTDILTSSMRDRLIFDPETKEETPVVGSWVSMEIESETSVATVTRWVKDDRRDSGLIQVQDGAALSETSTLEVQDYFVGRAGAVANPRGFHRWLAEFMGWEMPQLPAREGKLAPLYLEQVFPLLLVDQRRGWAGIQAQMPAFSGVSDVRRRAIEFLLDLDVGELEVERQRLLARKSELQSEWSALLRGFQEAIAGRGLVTAGLPEAISLVWPLPEAPSVVQSVDDGWIPASVVLADLRSRRERQQGDMKVGDQSDDDAEQALVTAIAQADENRQAEAILRENIIRDRDELKAVEGRLVALREDLREHQDLVTLQRLGSEDLDALHNDCPVCHQQLPKSLLSEQTSIRTLSPEDTVAYLQSQIELFETMHSDGNRALTAKRERLAMLRGRGSDLRSQVRALRTDLTNPVNTPSSQEIARRIRLDNEIEQLEIVEERFLQLMGELGALSDAGKEVAAALKALPKDQLSDADKKKLSELEQSFLSQLHEYEFGSFSDEQLRISPDDYRPRREDWDLQADISASDSIRVVWAYLLGLLEVAGRLPTQHPGLLVFDEPRQQSAERLSFAALLKRAASNGPNSQILFATSEESEALGEMLSDLPHQLHSISGYLLKPVSD